MKTRIYISGINLVLSSDEIIELRKEYIGRNKHHRSFKIIGKIFTGLTDKEVEESDMITMSKKESMDYFPEMTIKILEENFSRVDINEMEKNLKKKIYEHNRENIRKIVRWSNSPENCYQTMIIETILETDSPVFLIIPSVFVKKMSVSASVDEGVGEFELLLYQRFNVNESVTEIYKENKGTSNPPSRSTTKNNVIVTDNNTPLEYVSDEQVEKNSANIGLITDNKIEDDETEVYLLDVNDEHVKFLFGEKNSTNIYKTIIKKTENEEFYNFLTSNERDFIGYKDNLKFLFKDEAKNLDIETLKKFETLEYSEKLSTEEIANLPFDPTGSLLWGKVVDNALRNNIYTDNFINTLSLKINGKLKGESSILEEDYFIYKVEKFEKGYLVVGISKDIHYSRNNYQKGKIPTTKGELLSLKEEKNKKIVQSFKSIFKKYLKDDINEESFINNIYYFEKERIFFKKLSVFKSLYHGITNEKFVNIFPNPNLDELFEVVFDSNGNIVLNDEELGTFNFYGPSKSEAHTLYDVIPYWLWGNTPNDKTTLSNRIAPVEKTTADIIKQDTEYRIMVEQAKTKAVSNLINSLLKK